MKEVILMTFGQRLRQSRTIKKMTQKQLATAVGAKHNSVSDWENDKNKPDPDTIELLCGVLEITPNYLLNSSADDISPFEKEIIKKYRDLDTHGKEMVDFTLEKEYERSVEEKKHSGNVVSMPVKETSNYEVNAAHARTDIDIPDNIDTSENDIMDDDNF